MHTDQGMPGTAAAAAWALLLGWSCTAPFRGGMREVCDGASADDGGGCATRTWTAYTKTFRARKIGRRAPVGMLRAWW